MKEQIMPDVDEKILKNTNFKDIDIAELLERISKRPFIKKCISVIVFINIWIAAFAVSYYFIDKLVALAIDFIEIGSVSIVLLSAVLSFFITLIAVVKMG